MSGITLPISTGMLLIVTIILAINFLIIYLIIGSIGGIIGATIKKGVVKINSV